VFHIEKTNEFNKWLRKLKDFKAKAKILFRIQKLETDEHFGDCYWQWNSGNANKFCERLQSLL
jgi:putative component of toxin-antitoxin plasmid stabilization module